MRLTTPWAVRRYWKVNSQIGKYTKAYANLPERFLARRSTRLGDISDLNDETQMPYIKTADVKVHTMDRPWSDTYWMKHKPFEKTRDIFVEPILEEDWMWFRGDRVEIVKEGADFGKQGYINYVIQERNWVCVEGMNLKHQIVARTRDFPGILISTEKPLLVTEDIKLVDPTTEKAANTVEWRYTEEGERVRVAIDSDSEIPIPSAASETIDYKTPSGYAENEAKDTPAKFAEEISFEPKLATFDMDIMESMGIKEERIPKKTYWY
ncbi:large ribosomal subunit protein uL24m [Lepeophtheirus salmonis]|uniref:large ribosomal subunit protein uL24m n=1 Tax=Lepeophtheirus salmonis TaxID=72036 RepID=UPI001AE4A9BC|nr:probable 39S ribosomal protein L24, mitochondrial [Lepeophtheirus salmonis]